mgnify:CR=1 FL=1
MERGDKRTIQISRKVGYQSKGMINLKGKKIKYYIKNVYGTDRFYLNDPNEARNLQRLTKDKTMSTEHMQALQELADVEFEQVLPHKEIPF